MVISEENKNSLLGDSLASQLEQASLEQQEMNDALQMPNPVAEDPSLGIDASIFSHEDITKVEEDSRSAQEEALANIQDTPTVSFDFLDDSKSPVSFGTKTKIKNYTTPFYYAVLGTGLCAFIAIITAIFNWYLNAKALPNTETTNEYVESVSTHYNAYGQMIGLFDFDAYKSTDLTIDGKSKIQNLISAPDLNYPQKKDLLQYAATDFWQKTIGLKQEIKTITDQLNKDGFFPEELVTILKQNNSVSSIQRSLLSLEVVKFSSAMKVFSLMDVFLTSLSNELAMPKSEIKQRLNDLLARGENDVKNYLNYCYNNPYEPANCSIIGDFDTYYRLSKSKQNFDTGFFKTMMDMIDRKLENAQLPSFSITFNDFDSKSGEISFSVEVNTLKEDEYALIREGIKSPHIFIVSELIKLLKQSTFILGKSIDIKEMQVSEKEEEIWGSSYKYHTSSKVFTLPIQKNTKREIFDYVDSYKIFLDEQDDRTASESQWYSQTLFDKLIGGGGWDFFGGENDASTGAFLNAELPEHLLQNGGWSGSKRKDSSSSQNPGSGQILSGASAAFSQSSRRKTTSTGESTPRLSTSALEQVKNSQ